MKDLIKAKLAAYGVAPEEFFSDSTEKHVVWARRSIILTLSERGMKNPQIAKLIKRNLSTVRYWLSPKNRGARIRRKAADRLGGPRITKDQRKTILETYLEDKSRGTAMAISMGLGPLYAYKLAHAMGAIPLTRHAPRNGHPNNAQIAEHQASP